MDKTETIEKAIADRRKYGLYWYDLQRKYPGLTTDEIFCDVIGECNSQRHKDAIAQQNKRQAQKNR